MKEYPISYKRYLDQGRLIFTDSRKIVRDGVFVALHGSSFDGNKFAVEALEKGAAYAIVDQKMIDDPRLILVKDTLKELQLIGTLNRQLNKAKIIAITGSNGKTTTKELCVSIFKLASDCIGTLGNFNNHIGVPLTLLRITESTEFAIVEMGANKPGDIAELARLAQPDLGHITNIGKAHLEGFGSLEGVIKTKMELFQYVKSEKGKCIYNLYSDPLKNNYHHEHGDISFGSRESGADFTGELLQSTPSIIMKFYSAQEEIEIHSGLFGDYNYQNIMSSATIGAVCGIPMQHIKKGIERYIPDNMRSQIVQYKGNTIILDAYNANPNSMKEVIEIFQAMDHTRKWVILGEMAELGIYAPQEHEFLINLVGSKQFDKMIFIGKLYEKHKDNPNFLIFDQLTDAKEWLDNNWPVDTTILVKGSRSSSLEKLIH